MSDATRRRQDPLDVRPSPATVGGEVKRPPAPGAVSSPQIPGKVPDRTTIPGHGQLPVPKAQPVVRPLTEYGTTQQIMDVFALAPGEEDSKERWEQATASYEELRKGDPTLLTPVRPARTFTGLVEGLAGKAIVAEEELVPLPAESVSSAGVPSGETKGDVQEAEVARAITSPAPAPAEATAAPTTATATATATAAPTEPAPPPAAPPSAAPSNPRLDRIPQTGWVAGDGTRSCPPQYPIKGNADSQIYHLPGSPAYDSVTPELCFASVEAAAAAGFRPPRG
jgi:hypothetical protein